MYSEAEPPWFVKSGSFDVSQTLVLCLVVWGPDSWTQQLRPRLRELSFLTGRDKWAAAEKQTVIVAMSRPGSVRRRSSSTRFINYDDFHNSKLESIDTGSRPKARRLNASVRNSSPMDPDRSPLRDYP